MAFQSPSYLIVGLCVLAGIHGQLVEELPDNINKSACVPLIKLQDAAVERELGEDREIRQIQIYLTGRGNVEFTVLVATKSNDPDFIDPIFHTCGGYHGTADEVKVTIDCLEQFGGNEAKGYVGYAVSTQFHGDLMHHPAAVCQMDIVLRSKSADKEVASIHTTIVVTSVLCTIMIVVGVGVIVWYIRANRYLSRELEALEEFVVADEKPNAKSRSTLHDDDDDDDVFLPDN